MNRPKNSRPKRPTDYMFLSQRYKGTQTQASPEAQPPMRIAKPGERPPSRRPAGVKDDTIERFDAYTQSLQRR